MKSRLLNSIIVLVILLGLIAISPAIDSTLSACVEPGQRWTPGEYEPASGVLVPWEPGSYHDLLTDFVVDVTSDPNTDSIAFVIVWDSIQEDSARTTLEGAGADMDRIRFIYYDLDTVWICDYGPRYIVDENDNVAIIDHTYNCSSPMDNAFPQFIRLSDVPFEGTEPEELMDLVHSGGNFLCVSNGDAFMSSLILDENSSKTEQEIKDIINNHFNVDVTIYDGLIPNVDSTGNIDMWMMPLSDSKIVISEFPADHPLSKATTDAAAADLESRGYSVYRTPAYNSTGEGISGGTHYTYTNAAIVNNKVFIPQYGTGHESDDTTALNVYQTALPDYEIIQLDCSSIIDAGGAIHSIIKQVCVPEVKLGFTTVEQSIVAGNVSPAMTIQTQDAAGNPINVTMNTQIDLHSSSTGSTFYSDAGGTIPITCVTIGAGTSSASFYYKDTLVGSPIITGAEYPDQGWTDVAQEETVTHAPLDHFHFDNISDQAEDMAFSITITALDAYGNTVTSYTGCNTISDGNGTINPTSTGTFTAGVWTGDVTITSPYTSVTLTTSGEGRSGASNAFKVTGDIDRLIFTTACQSISAGEVSSVMTIQTNDRAGNPIYVSSDRQINLHSSSTGGTFYSDASGTIQITSLTISAGTSSASFYYNDTLAGSPVITAAESPDQGWTSAAQEETVTHADLDHFAFDNIANQAKDAAFSITITALDAYGNMVTSYTGTNSISDDNGTIIPTSTGEFVCGVWTGEVTITSPYTAITITTSGEGRDGVSNPFAVTAVKLVFTTAMQTITAGEVSSDMTIQAWDVSGNPINVTSDMLINLHSSSAGGTFYSDASGTIRITSVTIGAGTRSASFYYKDTLVGSPIITGAEYPDQGWTDAAQEETVTHAALDHFAFANIANQEEDAAFSITITALDAYGNTVTSFTGTNTISDGNGTITPPSTGKFTAGMWTGDVTITSPYASVNISTSGGGRSGASNAFKVTGNIARLGFTTTGQTITAGEVSPVMTIQTQDAAGNPIDVSSDRQINLHSSSTCGTFYSDASGTIQITSVTINAGTSSASFYYKDTLAGSPVITAAESLAQSWADAIQEETVTHAALDHFAFDNIANQAKDAAFSITITALDAYGNMVTSYTGSNTLNDGNDTINPTSTGRFTTGVWTGDVAITSPYTAVNITTSGGGREGISNTFDVKAGDIKIEPGEIIHIRFEIINNTDETSTVSFQYQVPEELIIKSVSVEPSGIASVLGNSLSAVMGSLEAGNTASINLTVEVSRDITAETSLAGLLKTDYLLLDIEPVEAIEDSFSISNLVVERSKEKYYSFIPFAKRAGERAEISMDVTRLESPQAGDHRINIFADDILLHTIDNKPDGDTIIPAGYNVELIVNGEVLETRKVELESGETEKVVFDLENLETGEYTVNISGLEAEFDSTLSINWWLIFTSILAVVFIGYIVKSYVL